MEQPQVIVVNNELIFDALGEKITYQEGREAILPQLVRTHEEWMQALGIPSTRIVLFDTAVRESPEGIHPAICIDDCHQEVLHVLESGAPPNGFGKSNVWQPPSLIDCDTGTHERSLLCKLHQMAFHSRLTPVSRVTKIDEIADITRRTLRTKMRWAERAGALGHDMTILKRYDFYVRQLEQQQRKHDLKAAKMKKRLEKKSRREMPPEE